MNSFEIKYNGNLRTSAKHLESGSTINTDAPKDNHGLGECFSPTDLVASSLASCMITIIAIAKRTHSLNIDAMNADVDKIMSSSLPRKISQINVKISIQGNLDDKSKLIIERSAKNCPVHHTLGSDTVIDLSFNYS